MFLFSTEAILASSTSKNRHLNSSYRWRRLLSHPLINHPLHSFRRKLWASTTSVLNLIFQQANVAGVGNVSKWRSEICSRCWSAQKSFTKLPSLGSNEFLADGPDWHLGVKTVSGIWRSPHVTGRPVLVSTGVSSVTLQIQGLNPPG